MFSDLIFASDLWHLQSLLVPCKMSKKPIIYFAHTVDSYTLLFNCPDMTVVLLEKALITPQTDRMEI